MLWWLRPLPAGTFAILTISAVLARVGVDFGAKLSINRKIFLEAQRALLL